MRAQKGKMARRLEMETDGSMVVGDDVRILDSCWLSGRRDCCRGSSGYLTGSAPSVLFQLPPGARTVI